METAERESYKFTEKLQNKFREESGKLSTLYCREDAEQARSSVLKAKPDYRKFRMGELISICKSCGIDADALLKDKSLLLSFPSRDEVFEKIDALIYEMYQSTPAPHDSMERIVRRLAPEYNNDSVRLAILKKFVSGVGFDCDAISINGIVDWALDHMNTAQKKEYLDKEDDAARLQFIIDSLDEQVFEPLDNAGGISNREILELMVRKTETIMNRYKTVDEDMQPYEIKDAIISDEAFHLLNSYCVSKGYGDQKDKRVLDILQMILEKDSSSLEDLGACMEKLNESYKKWLNTFYYTDRKGTPKKAFQIYKESLKDRRKQNVKDVKLLKMADDFANGVFRTDNGAFREKLYWFAIIFGMTASVMSGEPADDKTDIEKNLFEDYYCDNLMRFLSPRYKAEKNSMFEKEPTGEGINPKNYVEAIYLYCLCHQEIAPTAGLRIDKAKSLVKQCEELIEKVTKYTDALQLTQTESDVNSAEYKEALKTVRKYKSSKYEQFRTLADSEGIYHETIPQPTYDYREIYLKELYEFDETAIPEYIARNFLIVTNSGEGSKTKMQQSASEHTAYTILSDILEETRYVYEDPAAGDHKKKKDEPLIEIFDPEEDNQYSKQIFPVSGILRLADYIAGNHGDDTDFVMMINYLKERFMVDFTLAGKEQVRMMTAVLRSLANAAVPFTMKQIRDSMNSLYDKDLYGFTSIKIVSIRRSIASLKEIGFSITANLNEDKEEEFSLDAVVYPNVRMNELINAVSGNYLERKDFNDVCDALANMILMMDAGGSRPTRSMLIIAKAIEFVNKTEELDEITLPAVHSSFAAHVNGDLEEARYQRLSEKNIFDIFTVCGLYAALLDERLV